MRLCIADIVSATGGKLICGNLNAVIKDVSTDTRKIEIGSFFVAIKGANFDGHDFIVKAKQLGASGCLIQRKISDEEFEQVESEDFAVIEVEDTIKALLNIAAAQRRIFEGRVCAVTGSVGKTSTKDMIASVVSKSFSVHKTQGNFNNEIGMPMTILGLKEEHDALILEMGMRGLGEIDYLASAAKPDIGIITNIGVSHIERLGSKENICKAKMEIASHIKTGGFLLLNGDDEYLKNINKFENITIMTFGIENENCDVCGKDIRISDSGEYTEFELHIKSMPCEIYNVRINVPGIHNIYNALCAVCVGIIFQMNMSEIIDGIADYVPSGMRQNISISSKGYKIINDAYNASPDSVKASLAMLSSMNCEGRKIAVLGDMLELGENSMQYHREIGEYLLEMDIDVLVTVGNMAKSIAEIAVTKFGESNSFDGTNEALNYLKENLNKDDIILLKASRGIKFEEIAAGLE